MTLDGSVIAFFAHPDDESLFSGGLLAMLAEKNTAVHLVSATRGEGGALPAGIATRERLGVIREMELRHAAEQLGAASVSFLGYVDLENGMIFDHEFRELVNTVVARILQSKAQVILTHGSDGEDGHPAHQVVHRAVAAAMYVLRSMTAWSHGMPQILLYTVSAGVPNLYHRLHNHSDRAHFVLDVTPWYEQKVAALDAHESQAAILERRVAPDMDVILVESLRRVWPPVADDTSPGDVFAQLVLAAGAVAP